MLARAVATESGSSFLSVSISDIVKGEVGESEKTIAGVFARARRLAPCILFFDEFQALFGKSRAVGGSKLVSQFLLELDALALDARRAARRFADTDTANASRVMVLAATNLPNAVDSAFLRPGRFDRVVLVPPPDASGRAEIMHARRRRAASSLWAEDVDIDKLCCAGGATEGFTGADLDCLCQTAALLAIQEVAHSGVLSRRSQGAGFQISMRHFELAAEKVKASVTEAMMRKLHQWQVARK